MDSEGSFAAALRAARHDAGLTLEELAEASGVSVRALSDMERGRALGPQRRTVALIADALKLDGARRDEFVALAKAGRTRSAYLAAAPGLCELPGSIGDFTGRAAELAWISRLVDALDGVRRPVRRGGDLRRRRAGQDDPRGTRCASPARPVSRRGALRRRAGDERASGRQ